MQKSCTVINPGPWGCLGIRINDDYRQIYVVLMGKKGLGFRFWRLFHFAFTNHEIQECAAMITAYVCV